MKKDQYIPHEVSMRQSSEIMNLIEEQGMTGYGIYWSLMEYLRTQDDYTGDIRVLKTLARQLKTSVSRLEKILSNYGLFVVSDGSFRSHRLNAVMKPLEDKRRTMNRRPLNEQQTNVKQNACNSLEINNDSSLSKVKESKVKKSKVSSSKEEDAEVAVAEIPSVPLWERYIDSLKDEQQWLEIMAMRSGLGKSFVQRFDEILRLFKQHVQAVGGEKQILSPGDAKRYFCFYNTPGSAPFNRLMEQLKQDNKSSPYRHEQRDPVTGQRSYCGVPIPPDAPPRPDSQAVWSENKWVF